MTPGTARSPNAALARTRFLPLLAALIMAMPAQAGTVALHELLRDAGSALDVLLAEAEYAMAYEDWNRARAEKGWKLSASAGYGRERDVIDEARTRSFDSVRTRISLSYPLLGARGAEERAIEQAGGAAQEKRIRRDAALAHAGLEIESAYAEAWGAQESLEVIDAYLAGAARFGGDEAGEAAVAYARARRDRRRTVRARDEAIVRLEQLSGRELPDFIAMTVQLPRITDVDLDRLRQDHPKLAALRARRASAQAQLDQAAWHGIDAGFDITQSTVRDRSDNQSGDGLSANLNVSLPFTFYQAGIAERGRLRAQVAGLDLTLRQAAEEIIGGARQTQAEHLDLFDEVEALTRRTQSAGQALRRGGQGETFARRLRSYYAIALDEIDARTRYWRSHIELRRLVPVGAAEPAPTPPGPEAADIGTRLAGPLASAARPHPGG